jgi:hypothetical protein
MLASGHLHDLHETKIKNNLLYQVLSVFKQKFQLLNIYKTFIYIK